MFEPLLTRLSDKFHMIAPDYPGFGHSDAPPPKAFAVSPHGIRKGSHTLPLPWRQPMSRATCRGFGRTIAIDLARAIPDRGLSIAEGVVKPFQTENGRECQRDLMRGAAVREDVRGGGQGYAGRREDGRTQRSGRPRRTAIPSRTWSPVVGP